MHNQSETPLSYQKRSDGKISIVIDSNAWNFLWEEGVDLAQSFPSDRFLFFCPRQIEIEIEAIPSEKSGLIDYIKRSSLSCGIRTTSTFGFFVAGQDKQRRGGFGHGTFQSPMERRFYAIIRDKFLLGKSERNSGLAVNEGDAAVAVQAFFAVVLTNERPGKQGPLRVAAEHGGKVLYLSDFRKSARSLSDYLVAFEKSL
jgi:hypothetical protein